MRVLFALLIACASTGLCAAAPVVNAGPDRSALVNETLSIDGSASTGGFDGLQPDGRHSMRWTFGYGGWTYEGGLIAPVAYPIAGSYTVTLTVCDSAAVCSSDSAQVTISNIPEGAETVLSDTGNPVTNMANLQAQVDTKAGTASPVITLPVGFVARGTLILKHRTSATYMTIRTAGHASLPNGSTRVSSSHGSVMAILEQSTGFANIVDTPAPSSNPARYYRFLGIQFRKSSPSLTYFQTYFSIGQNNETSVATLPSHIQIDRCYFNGGDTTSTTLRGVLYRANDSSVVNSYFHRFKGFQVEVQAALTLMGERQAFINNFMEGSTENYMSGGSNPSISGHVPTDIVFRRNYLKKDLGWKPDDPSFYGTNMVIKNLFEIKIARRFSAEGNFMETHWLEDQPGYAVVITVRNDEGFAPWSQISFVDFARNKVQRIARGLNIFGSDDLKPSLPTHHVIVRHNVFVGINFGGGISNTIVHNDGPAGFDRVHIVNNSTDQNGDPGLGQGRLISFETASKHTNYTFSGNIGQGFINHNNGTGTAAFNACCGSLWSATKNGFYRSSGSNPPDNTTVATRDDVKFVDVAGFDLSLRSDSPFLTTGFAGGRSGADVAGMNIMIAGTTTGVWSAGSVCRWSTVPACSP